MGGELDREIHELDGELSGGLGGGFDSLGGYTGWGGEGDALGGIGGPQGGVLGGVTVDAYGVQGEGGDYSLADGELHGGGLGDGPVTGQVDGELGGGVGSGAGGESELLRSPSYGFDVEGSEVGLSPPLDPYQATSFLPTDPLAAGVGDVGDVSDLLGADGVPVTAGVDEDDFGVQDLSQNFG